MRNQLPTALLIATMLALAGSRAVRAQHVAPPLTIPAAHATPRSLSRLEVGFGQLVPSSEAAAGGASTRRYVLIGAGVGAAVGVAIGAISVHNHPPADSYSPSARATVVGLGVLGAAAGALVGWLLSVAAR